MLKLVQNKLRDNNGPVEKFRFAHIGDSSVDNDARVHDFDVFFPAAPEQLFDVGRVESLSLTDSDGNADISEKCIHKEQNKIDDAPFERYQFERRRNYIRRGKAEDEASDTADNNL